jgi:hypothetical protein
LWCDRYNLQGAGFGASHALMQIREDKLKLKVSIPRKLEDGWEPIIKMNVNDFDCNILCDLGARISVGLPLLENCYFDVPLAEVAKKKPLGRINDVLIMVSNNLVPVDFLVLVIECNASCPIILGRSFLRTVGAIIDMKEAPLNINSHSRKVWKTSLETERSYLLILSLEQIMMLMLFHLKILDSYLLRLAQRH